MPARSSGGRGRGGGRRRAVRRQAVLATEDPHQVRGGVPSSRRAARGSARPRRAGPATSRARPASRASGAGGAIGSRCAVTRWATSASRDSASRPVPRRAEHLVQPRHRPGQRLVGERGRPDRRTRQPLGQPPLVDEQHPLVETTGAGRATVVADVRRQHGHATGDRLLPGAVQRVVDAAAVHQEHRPLLVHVRWVAVLGEVGVQDLCTPAQRRPPRPHPLHVKNVQDTPGPGDHVWRMDEPIRFDTKIAVLVRDDLETWQRLNVTAFLVSGIVAEVPTAGRQAATRTPTGRSTCHCSDSRSSSSRRAPPRSRPPTPGRSAATCR